MVPVTEWHNGHKVYSPVSEAELNRRHNDVRGWMTDYDVDALLTSYHRINYYSGFLYCYFGHMRHGHHAPWMRSKPECPSTDTHLDLWEKNVAVHRRGLELIKLGARCCDIAIELNEVYRQWGLLEYRSFDYGHSLTS